MRLMSFLPSSLVLMVLACSDGKSPTGPSASAKESLLTGTKWKVTAHTISPGVDYADDGTLVTDLFAVESQCSHDDITSFSADGKFVMEEGATKCDPADPQQEKGTWSLNAAGDRFTHQSELDSRPMVYQVVELSARKLVLSSPDEGWGDGKSHTDILTFSPI